MIENHYTKTFKIKRLQVVSGDKKNFVEIPTENPCHLQPFTSENSSDLAGSFGKEYLLFTSSTVEIFEEDIIIIDNVNYKIMSLEKFAFLKQCKHQELRIKTFQ